MARRFLVVETKPNGGVEVFPMKEWCYNHPSEMPPGLNVRQVNSHRIRDELKRIGWTVEENDAQVLMLHPGFADDGRIQETLGTGEPVDENEPPETVFGLEAQLQEFLAYNIETIQINGKN
ncbi:hypothetical protein HDG34_007931 [Paraburkholderia sp. HC6.4b]|uniref:hypothetical protein n=1 Tax=unclassified Paraburkholderia TaxID=2615204 RepID=UPI00185EFC1B|nr:MULTISPECIES: hypothetical protein [unclassified Paraburkholderia]MBB5413948.1 hypothetical protein [Paraburkholderia sp. HC6.4b]MBB5456346.1 hypothetical protein [Paraburkholderia sp. Kb1A]